MDPCKRLTVELDGLKEAIYDYTSSGAANFLTPLEKAIDMKDKETIIYCLDSIIEWYNKNLTAIHSNELVISPDEHDRLFSVLKEIRADMDEYEFSEDAADTSVVDSTPIIFLSHRSSDKKYADALEKFLVGLGVKNNQLIYTSHPLHKIPLDKNIYDYLRDNINRNIYMIFLWSNDYLESPACMNEMGAAWVAQCDYTNIYVPNFSFGNPKYHECAVDTHKMGAVLNGDEHCKQSMYELKDKIDNLFELHPDEKTTAYLIDAFIKEIKEN